jgi:hypothetical protein
MTAARGRHWLVHGTRAPFITTAARDGVVRPSQAAFVVPADTAPGDPRLRRTLVVALAHAVGLQGWRDVDDAISNRAPNWVWPALVLLPRPPEWAPPASAPSYVVRGRVGGPLPVPAGPTFPYLRVRDVGPLRADRGRARVLLAGGHDLAAIAGPRPAPDASRWFRRKDATAVPRCVENRAVCDLLAAQLIEMFEALSNTERRRDDDSSDRGAGGRRRIRQSVG